MENLLKNSGDKQSLIETFYMYNSLFNDKFLNKELLSV